MSTKQEFRDLTHFATVAAGTRPGWRRRVASRRGQRLLPVVLALVLLPGAAFAQMYRWVDEQGEVHLTDDPNSIPAKRRPQGDQMTPSVKSPPSSADSGRRSAPAVGRVALWLRMGGLRGEQGPVLIGVYDTEEKCMAERDRRTAVHASQGMQPSNQPGLAISNLGGTVVGAGYFAYRCVPAGIPPP
jgi:hypothetical protein